MIATKESFEPHSSEQLPGSKKIYVAGRIHPDVRVPMREIELAPTKSYTGAIEAKRAGARLRLLRSLGRSRFQGYGGGRAACVASGLDFETR